jgi:hypothetical protein
MTYLGRRRCLPCPPGQLLEPVLAIGVKDAFGVDDPLVADPITEVVAIDGVGVRDAGVTVAFDVTQQLAEAFLPTVGDAVPCPAGQACGGLTVN